MPTVAEVIAQQLSSVGVKTVYGLPGGENLPLLDAIRRENIEFVLVRNESSAVFMASVASRLSRVPGVALTTLGPGATNAYVGVAHAFLDRAPVLFITAETPADMLSHHTHQVLDLQAVFRPVTRMTKRISPNTVYSSMRDAFAIMNEGYGGPVHLGLAKDVATQKAVPEPYEAPTVDDKSKRIPSISAAHEILSRCERPIIVVGLGLEPEQPYDELRHFVEVTGAPLIDTPKSKGALPADHALYAGTIGLSRTDAVYELLDESDCIIAVGFDVVELVKPWDYKKPLIWLASWENDSPKIPADFEFVGAVAPALDMLTRTTVKTDLDWGIARVKNFRESLADKTSPPAEEHRVLPQAVLDMLQRFLPDETAITTDVGSHKIFTALNWKAKVPNRYFVSNGLSAMGYGLPAAIAAAKITNQLSVCITGDAGLAMCVGELALLAQMKLPVIVVLMNDAALNLIREGQIGSNLPVFGTEFVNPDYEAIAKGYGLKFSRVHDYSTLSTSVKNAVKAQKPTLIEVLIDPAGYRK